jgi:hypothetical protein
MTITEFLLERIDDDEWQAKASLGERLPQTADEEQWSEAVAARVLAECAAKRAIVTSAKPWLDTSKGPLTLEAVQATYIIALRALAAIYADHPDYRQEWAV